MKCSILCTTMLVASYVHSFMCMIYSYEWAVYCNDAGTATWSHAADR